VKLIDSIGSSKGSCSEDVSGFQAVTWRRDNQRRDFQLTESHSRADGVQQHPLLSGLEPHPKLSNSRTSSECKKLNCTYWNSRRLPGRRERALVPFWMFFTPTFLTSRPLPSEHLQEPNRCVKSNPDGAEPVSSSGCVAAAEALID